VIICNEKARPSIENLRKLNELLDRGYAIAGLYLYGFFGFDKELIRWIGAFDERFVGGWYEDNDFCLRVNEAGLAGFYSKECDYLQLPSAWRHEEATQHFFKKWEKLPEGGARRLLPEEPVDIDLGPHIPKEYLTNSNAVYPDYYRWMFYQPSMPYEK
jgi:hypothetical protein